MTVSESSLAFCLAQLRKNRTLAEVAAEVREKFEGYEQDIAIEWLRAQRTLAQCRKK